MPRRVTLQTIADHLSVSRTTVSNAYNRPDQLAPKLREEILETAEQLGYGGPDATARMLRTGTTGTIALLFTEDLRYVFNDPNTTLFMRGVAETSALAGTGLTLLPVPTGMSVEDTALGSTPADGYLVFSVADGHPALQAVLRHDLPVVIVDEPDMGGRTSFVGIDDHRGGQLAADHLVKLGHQHIAVLVHRLDAEPQRRQITAAQVAARGLRVVRERVAGLFAVIEASGLDPNSVIIWEAGDNDPDAGRDAAAALLADHPETTALFCTTDQLAIGATQAAVTLGRDVPTDLSVIGFDDIPRAATWEPALTTIRQPLVEKGRVAAELLLSQIQTGVIQRVDLPIELVVRASSGPPPTRQAHDPDQMRALP
jgi:DNA-binding LacI/PurR family transcriptional regulator